MTAFAERQKGIVSTPESFDLPADKKFALTDRFLQSLDEAGREAVAAYRAALEVRTREQLPQDWALTQNNLGIALKEQASRMVSDDKSKARELLNEAIEAYQAGLEVFTIESAPHYNTLFRENLDAATALLRQLSLD
ncbi:MAG TPA: hypothetical protein VH595_01565 [Verrucomicrobiae bacterium]|nr:hypothetical protein [Verrucomicrobiae bacterium]